MENTKLCEYCGGYGYTIEIEAVCCGNYLNDAYDCCNIPKQKQVQVQCKCDQGRIRTN